jgi:gentisate 1,2-dioxygenase
MRRDFPVATTRFTSPDSDLDKLYDDFAREDVQPLWTQHGLLPATPNGLRPHLWRGTTVRALAERAGDLVGIDRGGDRRVISLSHPGLGGLPFATHTLWAALQYLKGGELAPAHRHSPAALRFVLEGDGVWTLVNGDPLAMGPGDLVLTPSYTWHEHHNAGDQPMIWFDGLDLPLIRNLDAIFFEPGPDTLSSYEPAETSASQVRYGTAGLLPLSPTDDRQVEGPGSGIHSRLLTYRWADTDAALTGLLKAGNGADYASVRFCDPATGRDIMPTLRAEMHRIAPGGKTPATRTVGSSVWVVYHGTGSSVIDGVRYTWREGDMFVVPSWAAAGHAADAHSAAGADIFVLSDGPVIEAVGLGRTETLPGGQRVTGESDL